MHSLSEFGANVPAFLAKLWKLVDDPETNELISWSEEGTSFYIRDQAQFSRKLLPMYYKHNNMASFIRQLNMYGFHKIVSADAGSLRLDKDEMEFAHQCFLRGHPYLLEHIKRKVGKSQLLGSKHLEDGKDGTSGVVVKAEFMNKILSEVKSMRGRQETVENRLSAMKQENEALWRELSLLRQKHAKQQNIVNKLIQFLVTIVNPSQRLSKRRYHPLMINSVAHPTGKTNGKIVNDSMSRSPTGPTIHELDGDSLLPDDVESILPDSDLESLSSNTITLHVPGTELEEVINGDLEPDVLSPDIEVLDGLDSSAIQDAPTDCPTSVPLLEVNSEQEAPSGEGLNASSPSPELLLAVAPSELTPAVVVPGLRVSKNKSSSASSPQPTLQKTITRSASAMDGAAQNRSIVTRKSAGNTTKGSSPSSKTASSFKGISNNCVKKVENVQPVVKKEPRVLPTRNRKRKPTSVQNVIPPDLNNFVKPVDLLAEVGLADPESPTTSTSASGTLKGDNTNIIQSVGVSPLSVPTITDVTSPLVVQPPLNSASEQTSPQISPVGSASPYDMTLACTSQQGSNASTLKTPFNRCDITGKEDLDYHVGTVDNELGQLKDFLNTSGIQLDANTLLGLFSSEDTIVPDGDGTAFPSKMDSSGNELMYYQPDFMDLDIWNNDNGQSSPPASPVDALASQVNTPIMMPASPGFDGSAHKRRRM